MTRIAQFDDFIESLGLRHFKPHEVRFLGNSHYALGKGHGKNKLAPKSLWPRLVPVLRAADEARARLGAGVLILSSYRSPEYNAAIGGAKQSRHMECDALDLTAPTVSVAKLHKVLRELRKQGYFTGGIGRYPSFVHIDNRGAAVDF